jgi:beta-lactamase regulating signal transducer with metallopeptidase domain
MSDAVLAAAERILGWLVTYGAHSTLLLGAAALLGGRVAGSLKGRELLWKVALFGGVATATVQAGVGYVPLGGEWSGATLWGWMAPGSTPGNASSASPASGALPVAAAGVVLAWLAVAAVGVARVARSHRRFCRGLHRRPVRDAELLALLDELRAATGFTRPVRLSTSTTCPSPLALGTGEICVPAWFAADLGPLERRSVLAHELAHLARRDPLWQTAALALARALFFQPLNAFARRRLAEIAEYACDDSAVKQTGTPLGMLRSLAAAAERLPPAGYRSVGAAAMVRSGSPLAARVERLASAGHEPPRLRGWEIALAAGLIAAVAVAAPVCSTLPPAAPAWMPSSTDAAPLAVKPPVMVLQRRPGNGKPRAPATLLVRPSADGREAAVYAADAQGVGFPPRRLPPAEARAVLDALARAQRGAATTAEVSAEVRATGRGARE